VNRFAALLDQLAYEPRRNAKIALLQAYFRSTPDPDRGWALAAMTGALDFPHAKTGQVRELIASRVDPTLFALSYDYVGDLSETVALMWPQGRADSPFEARLRPAPPDGEAGEALALSSVVETLATLKRGQLGGQLERWLDALDETGRWALLKLITGGLRIGVSARLARTAVAGLGGLEADAVEEVWHGLTPPYVAFFAWIEGRGERPAGTDPVPFRPPMLAHPLEETDFDRLDPAEFAAEWKWDGIRVQIASAAGPDGRRVTRLCTRTGDDLSAAFPDLMEALPADACLDGELLVVRDGRVQSFNVLQQRLNRKQVSPRLIAEYPVRIRAYDLLAENGEDIRPLPYLRRRARLEALVARLASPSLDLSPQVPFASWQALAEARADPAGAGAGDDAEAVEGCMLKRLDSPYLPGRPTGYWYKWKKDPFTVDAVLMYAQRGHGKRSSFYSDFTFGLWREDAAGRPELVPVGKAYFGFTDEELRQLDRHVRDNTVNRFGPVREVVARADSGLVLEIAFEGIARSGRHKSGVAMRFPRISRIRRDKPPAEADRLELLERMIAARETAR
jgi:DNA ligase-1